MAAKTTDAKRLGKPSAYRLGQLRQQGVGIEGPRLPLRPQFARNYRRGPVTFWILGLLAAVALIAAGTGIGLWFLPFLAGVAGGLANQIGGWPLRVALPALAVVALAGWGLPLAWHVLHAAAAGYAALLLVAVAEALVGYWLGRVLITRVPW